MTVRKQNGIRRTGFNHGAARRAFQEHNQRMISFRLAHGKPETQKVALQRTVLTWPTLTLMPKLIPARLWRN